MSDVEDAGMRPLGPWEVFMAVCIGLGILSMWGITLYVVAVMLL